MNHQSCNQVALEELLHDDCSLEQQKDIELHLEQCEFCQTKLTLLAADEELWSQAASHLSTVNEIELPQRLTSRLNESTTFVVPALSDSSLTSRPHRAAAAFSVDTDWTRILDPPSHPEALGRIDKFEIESKIGQGGMGIVLKGFDRELNRAVAIKVLSPHLAINGTARKRFAREAESAAAVMHPNVVPIYSVNKSPARPYLVMQLVPGHSLQSLVVDKGPLNPKDVVRVSIQIAAGLAAAHKQGLIHRDVKPGNILIEQDVSRVMITDFGLARAADDAGMTQTGWLAGTPHYMSPEQSKGESLDARTDLFSLGSLMYFVATGREPFRGETPYSVIQKIVNQAATHPVEVNADVPTTLGEIIEKLMEKEPDDRFQSADEVCHVLEEYLAYLQQPHRSRRPKRILTARRKRRRALIWGLVVTGAIGGACWLANSFLPGINRSSANSASDPVGETTSPISSDSNPPEFSETLQPPPDRETALEPSPAGGFASVAEYGFFSNDEFSQELLRTLEETEGLQTSLRSSGPGMMENWTAAPAWPNGQLPGEIFQLDSQFQLLESSLKSENSPFSPLDLQRNELPSRPNIEPSGLSNPADDELK